jgi:DNA-binding response OmpR family regulator
MLSILVVDDDPIVRRLVSATLQDEGYRVSVAAGGEEAIALAVAVPPDAVVLDLQMPGMDGYAVFRDLRSAGVHAPVLILSAYGAHEARRTLQAAAALDKPFDSAELLRRLHRILPRTGEGALAAGS